MAVKHLSCALKIKKSGKDGIVIEGLANAATVDRMKEVILPKAWDLENYKKNPVILFDHGHDPTFGYMPIGKAVAIEARDEGLYVKALISSSKSEKISAIRDLIDEGILKTFSVGFDPKASEKHKDDPDINVITSAELIENSIVPIPMNQDSTFTMLRKRKAYWNTPLARKWYDKFCDRVKLVKKQAWVAAAVHQRLGDLVDTGEIRNTDAALRFVADEAKANLSEVKKALAGDLVPVPPQMVKAFAAIMRIDAKHLECLNKGDVVLLERMMAREADQREDAVGAKAKGVKAKAAAAAKKKAADAAAAKKVADKKKADAAAAAAKAKKDGKGVVDEATPAQIVAVCVPKEAADSAEAATKLVSDAGYKVDGMQETDTEYLFLQVAEGDIDTSKVLRIDLGNGVYAEVAPAAGSADDNANADDSAGDNADAATQDGDEADDAKGKADEEGKAEEGKDNYEDYEDDQDSEDDNYTEDAAEGGDGEGVEADGEVEADEEAQEDVGSGPIVLTDDDIKAAKETYTAEVESGKQPAWATDANKWKAALKVAGDDYGFACWAYLNLLGGGGAKGGSGGKTKNIDGSDDNPYLELAKGQTAVLGAILQELKGMNGKMDGLADLTLNAAQDQGEGDDTEGDDTEGKGSGSGEGKDDEGAKSLDLVRKYQRDLDKKLKKLNV